MTVGTSPFDFCPVPAVAGRAPQSRSCGQRRRSRRGLSTLELVLSLPILLFVMALMINYGTVASWKVRGLTVARHALWASRDRRDDRLRYDPWPAYWPKDAGIEAHPAGKLENLTDPRVNHLIARGPSITVSQEPPLASITVTVNEDLLDPTRGLHVGSATVHRTFPLMASLGQYTLRAHESLLDDRWQADSMGLDDYWIRRMDRLYTWPKAEGYLTPYYEAAMAVINAPCYPALRPLDRDEELMAANHPPNYEFHPSFQRRPVTLDKDEVRRRVDNLIDQISRVLKGQDENLEDGMEGTFLKLYRGDYD